MTQGFGCEALLCCCCFFGGGGRGLGGSGSGSGLLVEDAIFFMVALCLVMHPVSWRAS